MGRDQKSNQGYLFAELMNTHQINPKLVLNLNPKLLLSGIDTLSGMVIGLNYELNKRINLIYSIRRN